MILLPGDHENVHVYVTPHFDGKKESIINDSTATQAGILAEPLEEFTQKRNPFHIKPKQTQEMEKFEKIMRGDKREK